MTKKLSFTVELEPDGEAQARALAALCHRMTHDDVCELIGVSPTPHNDEALLLMRAMMAVATGLEWAGYEGGPRLRPKSGEPEQTS
jgi:hypothetical protein